MNNATMLVLPFDDALYTNNQSYAYLRPYTLAWKDEESDSLHLEYSYNGSDWYALNGNNGILFPSLGSRHLSNPSLFETNHNQYYITADDVAHEHCFFWYATKDFIHYTNEFYQATRYPAPSEIVQSPNENNSLRIPIQILHSLQAVWGKPEPVRLSKIEQINISCSLGDTPKLPSSVVVEYSNQMQERRTIDWANVPEQFLHQKGTFEVQGSLLMAPYPSPLIMHRADPYLYKHSDGFYYFTASYTDMSHNQDRKYQYLYVVLRRAASIADLADGSTAYEEKIIFEKKPLKNGTLSPHIWAPEIHYISGTWVIYYTTTLSERSSWKLRPHCLICSGQDPLQDHWDNKGPVQTLFRSDIAFTSFSLDHTYLEHKNRQYLIWAQKTKNISNLWIAELKNPWTICTKAVCISRPEYNWELHGFAVDEGPSILKRNGKIFITFSSSATDSMYCMGLLTADENSDLLDAASWEKTPYPVFQSSEASSIYGPGHNSFTLSEDNSEDLLIYHGRKENRYVKDKTYQPLYDAGRNTYIGKVFWNQDGTPNFSVPGASLLRNNEPFIITAQISIE
ncbi:MAG: family 43 glycosylhydrolase [Mobilitalea sp.]